MGKPDIRCTDTGLDIVSDGGIKFVKKVQQITFSGAQAVKSGQKVLYITERAVFRLTPEGLELIEIAEGVDLEKDVFGKMEFRPRVSPNLKKMDPRLFRPGIMGLKND